MKIRILFVFIIFISHVHSQNTSSLFFEENIGQFLNTENEQVSDVFFKTSYPGMDVFITKHGITYSFYKISSNLRDDATKKIIYNRVDMKLIDAHIDKTQLLVEGKSNHKKSIFNQNGHFENINHYSKITFKNIYHNVDWVLYKKNGITKYEFVVHPGGDVGSIKYYIIGNSEVELENENKIIISNPFGTLKDGELYCYEKETKKSIQCKYKIEEESISLNNLYEGIIDNKKKNAKKVEIDLETKNKNNQTIVIDPELEWGTMLYGNGYDVPLSTTNDENGNLFLTGHTWSTNFPTVDNSSYYVGTSNLYINIFISKFSSTGELIWSTYYGGSYNDYGSALCSDGNNNIFITGVTSSVDFPTLNSGTYFDGSINGNEDGFILKFDNDGNRLWATYVGGNETIGFDELTSIDCDHLGNIYLAGNTFATDFPTLNAGTYFQPSLSGSYDNTILKFSNTGVMLWSTYYGGNGDDGSSALSVNNNGDIYIVGQTTSNTFPTFNSGTFFQPVNQGNGDCYILKFDSLGNRIWATFYGGTDNEHAFSVINDNDNNLVIAGYTYSANFPIQSSGEYFYSISSLSDVFLLKFDSIGNRTWATYIAGDYDDIPEICDVLAVDQCNNIYLSYATNSSNIPDTTTCPDDYYINPVIDSAFQRISVLLKFSNQNELTWSTSLGNNGHEYRQNLSVDNNNNLFFVGATQFINDLSTFPISNNGGSAYFDSTFSANDTLGLGWSDMYISKFSPTCQAIASSNNTFCEGDTVFLYANCVHCNWVGPNGFISNLNNPFITPASELNEGVYTITDHRSCTSDTVNVNIDLNAFVDTLINVNGALCDGSQVDLFLDSSYTNMMWSNGENDSSIVVTMPGNYLVSIQNNNGCRSYDSLYIQLNTPVQPNIIGNNLICLLDSTQLTVDNNIFINYLWSNGSNNVSTLFFDTGYAYVDVIDSNFCTSRDSFLISFGNGPEISLFDTIACINTTITFTPSTNDTLISQYLWSFENGTPNSSTDSIVNVTYLNPGLNNVSLTVIGQDGCVSTMNSMINVIPPPISLFEVNNLCLSKYMISPSNQNLDSVYTILWNLGNGEILITHDTSDFAYNYFGSGTYTITQVVQNEIGCIDSSSINVNVSDSFNLVVPNVLIINSSNGNNIIDFNQLINNFNLCFNYSFSIFNRWGDKVFESVNKTDHPDMDCSFCFKGYASTNSVLTPGVYFYLLNGDSGLVKNGYITIFE